jgi:hypothetical protein
LDWWIAVTAVYSSLQLNAGAGFLPAPDPSVGAAIQFPPDLAGAVNTYEGINIVAVLYSIWQQAQTEVSLSNLSTNTLLSLLTLGAEQYAALTNVFANTTTALSVYYNGVLDDWSSTVTYTTGSVVVDNNVIWQSLAINANVAPGSDVTTWVPAVDYYRASQVAEVNANAALGNGDLTKFCQIFTATDAYVAQANLVLSSCAGANNLAQTFSATTGGMDNITTGSMNLVSNDLSAVSLDLAALGTTIDLGNLDSLGMPSQLLIQTTRSTGGMIPSLASLLATAGFTSAEINALANGVNVLNLDGQKALYEVMKNITDENLDQVLTILQVDNTRLQLTSMADLLDPRRMFPNSYLTLTCPTPTGIAPIYLEPGNFDPSLGEAYDDSQVNMALEAIVEDPVGYLYAGPNNTNSYSAMRTVIPSGMALANKALALSLSQIKNVQNIGLPALGSTMAQITTNQDLPLVQSLTVPVPAAVTASFVNNVGNGSAAGNLLTLTDIIGVINLSLYPTAFTTASNTINELNELVQLTPLDDIYTNMIDVLDGTYGTGPVVIPSGPAAGTYTDFDDAFVGGLIPATESILNSIAATNATTPGASTQSTMAAWTAMQTQYNREIYNQIKAQLDFSAFESNSISAAMTFGVNLHSFASQPAASAVLAAVANGSTLSGQSLTATLREGRNIRAMDAVGLATVTQIPAI